MRDRSRARFVWIYGVLAFGVPMALLFSTRYLLIEAQNARASPKYPLFVFLLYVGNLIIFGLLGWVFGWMMWRLRKRL
jgi:hypothetical protein